MLSAEHIKLKRKVGVAKGMVF